MKKSIITTCVSALVSVGALLAINAVNQSDLVAASHSSSFVPNVNQAPNSHFGEGITYLTFRSDDLWQTAYAKSDEYEVNKSFLIEHEDYLANNFRSFSYNSSFQIMGITAELSNFISRKETYYVIGLTDQGVYLVERWIHKPMNTQPPNNPILVYELKRKRIYTGAPLEVIEHISADPGGNHLVMAHKTDSQHVSQISLGPGYVTTQLFDASFDAAISSGIQSIARAQHETEGLIWLINTWVQEPYDLIVAKDSNGNGLLNVWDGKSFDEKIEFYPQPYTASPWTDSFYEYR